MHSKKSLKTHPESHKITKSKVLSSIGLFGLKMKITAEQSKTNIKACLTLMIAKSLGKPFCGQQGVQPCQICQKKKKYSPTERHADSGVSVKASEPGRHLDRIMNYALYHKILTERP